MMGVCLVYSQMLKRSQQAAGPFPAHIRQSHSVEVIETKLKTDLYALIFRLINFLIDINKLRLNNVLAISIQLC